MKTITHFIYRLLCVLFISGLMISHQSYAQPTASWHDIEQKAKGQTVYFYAWGGDPSTNNYLRWAAKELKRRHQITFVHAKVSSTAEITSALLANKTAQVKKGPIDLVWANGENFHFMKENDLLFGPILDTIPNSKLLNASLPYRYDHSIPTDGYEVPWGVAQLVFMHDKSKLHNPPQNFGQLFNYAHAFPTKISYPSPPDFHGTAFITALLMELTNNAPDLYQPVNPTTFDRVTKQLWDYLDQITPALWGKGYKNPKNIYQMQQLLNNGMLDIAFTFNPYSVEYAKKKRQLPKNTQTYAMSNGALTNMHFLSIPHNASAKEAALVAINFFLSPMAQDRKASSDYWGDPAVIDPKHLSNSHKLFPILKTPHPSWNEALSTAWKKRYRVR